jgi:hypothetical protein
MKAKNFKYSACTFVIRLVAWHANSKKEISNCVVMLTNYTKIIVTALLRQTAADHSHAASYYGTVSKHITIASYLRESLEFFSPMMTSSVNRISLVPYYV